MSGTDETPFDHAYAAIYGEFGVDDETATLYAESVIDYFALPSCPFRIVPASALPDAATREAITVAMEACEYAAKDYLRDAEAEDEVGTPRMAAQWRAEAARYRLRLELRDLLLVVPKFRPNLTEPVTAEELAHVAVLAAQHTIEAWAEVDLLIGHEAARRLLVDLVFAVVTSDSLRRRGIVVEGEA